MRLGSATGISGRPCRVLVVDDSPTMRSLVRSALDRDGRLRVIGEAADPHEARDLIRRFDPDVLTLDIEMPRMDGLTFLKHLMRLRPMPVVMISSTTARGSAKAIEALAAGAVDCISKTDLHGDRATRSFADRLVAAAVSRPRACPGSVARTRREGDFRWNGRLVLIGASTGGVEALETVLGGLPPDGPPVLVAQHMPGPFLERFAARLSRRIDLSVKIATQGMPLEPGRALIAPGGGVDMVIEAGSGARCDLVPTGPHGGFSPSVDALFASALPIAPRVVAVLLTGMGRDGAASMGRLRAAGARCLAQDAASSVVFGMPGAALASGAAEKTVPLDDIAGCIRALTNCAPTPSRQEDAGSPAG